MSDFIDKQEIINVLELLSDKMTPSGKIVMEQAIAVVQDMTTESKERTVRVTPLNIGLHTAWGTCVCGRQVEKPGLNEQRGAYYCPRCGAKLDWSDYDAVQR